MSAKPWRTPQSAPHNPRGQHFLVDRSVVDRLISAASITPGELVVDIGAGKGHLTIPLFEAGARVMAVERDPTLAGRLERRLGQLDATDVEIVNKDFRDLRLPSQPYRVVANPPFGLTSNLLDMLLEDPTRGPLRADLILQRDVVLQRAASPAANLRDAAWAPWWSFEAGMKVSRRAFRPVPGVDAAVLTIVRRDPPLLPEWMAPGMRDLLRKGWKPPETPRPG